MLGSKGGRQQEWYRQGWCGSMVLVGADGWCMAGLGTESSPAQGFADLGQTERDKTCLQDIFPLKMMISAGSACLQWISRKRKNTHKKSVCANRKQKPARRSLLFTRPPPRRNIGRRWGREARKLLKKNINENQILSASFFNFQGGDKGLPALPSGLAADPGARTGVMLVQPCCHLSKSQPKSPWAWARLALLTPLPWSWSGF